MFFVPTRTASRCTAVQKSSLQNLISPVGLQRQTAVSATQRDWIQDDKQPRQSRVKLRNNQWYAGEEDAGSQDRRFQGPGAKPAAKRQASPQKRLQSQGSLPAFDNSTRQPTRNPPQTQDAFTYMLTMLQQKLAEQEVIGQETWLRLFDKIQTKQQANETFKLFLQDAEVREKLDWDWATRGYGQTWFQFVQAAGRVGAYHVAEEVFQHTDQLHLTINKDFIPNMMRKLAAADVGPQPLLHLYQLEKERTGRNSQETTYELFRALRRDGDVQRVKQIGQAIARGEVEVKQSTWEDLQQWLEKRGVSL